MSQRKEKIRDGLELDSDLLRCYVQNWLQWYDSAQPRIAWLDFVFVGVAVPPLDALAGAPALESLTIEGTAKDDHLEHVAGAVNLRSLTFANVYLGPHADVPSTQNSLSFGARGLEAVARLRHLEHLSLTGEFTEKAPPLALAQLPRLERLDLRRLWAPQCSLEDVPAGAPPWVECLIPEEGWQP